MVKPVFRCPEQAAGLTGVVLKKTYRSKKQARKALTKSGSNNKPYLCPHCGNWHLTTKRKVK